MLSILDSAAVWFVNYKDNKRRKNIKGLRENAEKTLINKGWIESSQLDSEANFIDNLQRIKSTRIFSFDMECVDSPYVYESLFDDALKYLNVSKKRISVSCRSDDDDLYTFVARTKLNEWNFSWQQDGDYVDPEFLTALNTVISEACGYSFYILPPVSQEVGMLAMKRNLIDELDVIIEGEEGDEDILIGWFVYSYLFFGAIIAAASFALFYVFFNSPLLAGVFAIASMLAAFFVGSFRSEIIEKEKSEEDFANIERLNKAMGMIEDGTAFKRTHNE